MLFAVLLLAGCAKPVVIPVEPLEKIPPAEETQAALFHKAERLYESGAYSKSLSAFASYLNRFPRGEYADAALMKTGAIQETLGDLDAAHRAYDRVVRWYPESRFVPRAQVERVAIDYQRGNFARVIQEAHALLTPGISEVLRGRLFVLLGDAYAASGMFSEALAFYLKGYHAASEADREKLIARMDAVIEQMENEAIRSLMARTDDGTLKHRLVRAFAKNAAESENPEAAVAALTEFLKQYPEQDPDGSIRALLETLSARIVFNRYTLGCLLPLSGPYRAIGNEALRGIEMALMDGAATPEGPPVKLVVKDAGSDPESAAAGVRELALSGVAAVIGPIAEAEAAAVEAQKLKVPIVTLTQKENVTKVGDYVFRNFMTPRMQVAALVGFCVEKLGVTRFAVLYPEESYGETFMNHFWDAVIARGGTMVGVESYPVDQTDFADSIKKLVGLYYPVPEAIERAAAMRGPTVAGTASFGRSGEPGTAYAAAGEDFRRHGDEPYIDFEALFIPDAPDKAGLILPQLTFYDVRDVYLLGTNLWHSPKLLDMAQKYAQGALMTDGFDVRSDTEPTKSFVKRFTAAYGERPGYMEAVAYDTTRIILESAVAPHVHSRPELKNEILGRTGFVGLTGPTAFNADGEAKKTLFLFRVQGNRFIGIR